MIQFETICYLQNHKTGCTYVEEFLRCFITEPVVFHRKHAALISKIPGLFYFVNVRGPLSAYRSLYAYGLEGQGEVFGRLNYLGYASLYSRAPGGFSQWLHFVLDPENGPLVSETFDEGAPRQLGLMSWRFLRLACAGLEHHRAEIIGSGGLWDYVEAHYLIDAVLRQETLRADLRTLAEGRLASLIADRTGALDWIESRPNINGAPASAALRRFEISPALMGELRSRETYLYGAFYPLEPNA